MHLLSLRESERPCNPKTSLPSSAITSAPMSSAPRSRLSEKGVAFERDQYRSRRTSRTGSCSISPLGKVPLLADPARQRPAGRDPVRKHGDLRISRGNARRRPRCIRPIRLTRARHRGWMEFGSSILADLWGLRDGQGRRPVRGQAAGAAVEIRDARDRSSAKAPISPADFSLVDAVFAPVFRYFETVRHAGRPAASSMGLAARQRAGARRLPTGRASARR